MASTRIDKTFASAGTRNKWTFSVWLKGHRAGAVNHVFSYHNGDNARWSTLQITGTDCHLRYYDYNNGTFYTQLVSTRKLNDPNAWYHVVLRYDTPQSTAADRVRMYVNGEQLTVFDTATYPNQNHSAYINNDTNPHTIGHEVTGGYFEGCMTHAHFTDGYSYGADSFGSTDASTGEWKITTSPSVSYGTTGYFIFKNDAGVTDQSPNSNNWTASGSLIPTQDNPSNVYNILNPIHPTADNFTLSNGATKITKTSATNQGAFLGTIMPTTGKWYFEAKINEAGTSDRTRVGV